MSKSILKLVKTENLKGEIWYHIYHNDTCLKAFVDDTCIDSGTPSEKTLNEALDFFNKMKLRQKDGYPKVTTLESYGMD